MNVIIPQPKRSEQTGKIIGEFYPLQREELLALRETGLGRGPFYVHLCLRYENPWCDKPFRLNPETFCKRWKISLSKFYRSIAELRKRLILTITESEIFFCWTTPHSGNDSPYGEPIPHSGNEIPHSGNEIPHSGNEIPHSGNEQSSEPLPNGGLENTPPQTLQTNQKNHTFSEKRKNVNELTINQEEEPSHDYSSSVNDNSKISQQQDKSQSGQITPAQRDLFFNKTSHSRHPALEYDEKETPWLNPPRNKFDVNFKKEFLEFHGRAWMLQFPKSDVHHAIADFRQSLINNPDRIIGRWEQYHDHILHHASNIQVRMDNGIEPNQMEKEKMIRHLPIIQGNAEEAEFVEDAISNTSIELRSLPMAQNYQNAPSIPEGAESVAAYNVYEDRDASDHFRRLHEKSCPNVETNNIDTPIQPSEGDTDHIKLIAETKSMTAINSEERKRLRESEKLNRKLNHWNLLLQTGLPSVITEVERQVRAAGYEIVDGQVLIVEF